jgi:hypothetical protein
MCQNAKYCHVFLRMDGGAAKEEYERELEMKNQ